MATNCAYVILGLLSLIIVTGIVHGQGPPCTGQFLGEPSPTNTGVTTGSNTGTTYVLRDDSMKVPCCGVISAFQFATKAAGDITVQLWRSTGGDSYSVVGEKTVSVTSDNIQTLALGTSEQFSTKQGDIVGWHSSGSDIVPYLATGSSVMGRLSQSGKLSTATWAQPFTNGEQWMFRATLSAGSAPTFGTTLPATVTAETTDTVGKVVHTVTATDTNMDDVSGLSITINPASSDFEFDSATGEVKSLTSPLEARNYSVVFEVVDQCQLTATATLTVVVSDTRPNITSLPIGAAPLREDTKNETLLHTLTYTDDSTSVTCRMTPSTLPFVLKYITGTSDYGIFYVPNDAYPLNYDTQSLYQMFVTCNDGTSDSETEEFQVSIQPNEDPVFTLPSSIGPIDVKATNQDAVVYQVTATDPENDVLSYSMTCTCSNCTCPFDIRPNGNVYATENLATHKTTPYDITITVGDGYNNVTQSSTITLTNINTQPNVTTPSESSPAELDVHIQEHTDEGTPNAKGTTVNVIQAAGFDADSDTLTFEFDYVNGQGRELFNFDTSSGLITTNGDLDFEDLNSENLLSTKVFVRVFDDCEYSDTKILNIIVDDVNETPEFTKTLYAIATGETTATATLPCPLFEIIDEDILESRTYSIDCGSVTHFEVGAVNSGGCEVYIVQTSEDDQDSPGAEEETVTCTVTVTDKGGLTATTSLQIRVIAEDDNWPFFTQTSYTYTLSNDTDVGNTFGNADVTDADWVADHRRHTFSTDSSEFGIDHNGVFFSKRSWASENAPISRTFTATVTDDAGHQDTAPVVVNFVDVVETTTTTAAATAAASVYSSINSFSDSSANLAWLIPAILLGLLGLGLLGFMLYKCCTSGACSSFCRKGRGGRWFRRGPKVAKGAVVTKKTAQPAPIKRVLKFRAQRVVGYRQRFVQGSSVVKTTQGPVTTTGPGSLIGTAPANGPVTDPAPLTAPQGAPPEAPPPPAETTPPPKKSFFDRFKSSKPEPEPPRPTARELPDANERKPFTF